MRHFIVAQDSYIADRLLAAGSRITDAWLGEGTKPGSNLIETDESGKPLDPADTARLLAIGVNLGPVQVAPVAPHAPNPTRPQAIPAQPAGSVQIAGDREYVPADGVESNESAEARVETLRAALKAAEEAAAAARGVAPSSPDEPEAPQRRSGETGGAEPSVLDGSIADLTKSLASISDPAELTALRQQEVGGKSRTGALEAIDARFAELKA